MGKGGCWRAGPDHPSVGHGQGLLALKARARELQIRPWVAGLREDVLTELSVALWLMAWTIALIGVREAGRSVTHGLTAPRFVDLAKAVVIAKYHRFVVAQTPERDALVRGPQSGDSGLAARTRMTSA